MQNQKLLDDFKKKFQGNAFKTPQKVYTGGNVLGIATMHKSNAVPVFSQAEAQSISQMRR